MSSFPADTAQWLTWLARAQAALDALTEADDDYRLYELLHQQAECVCPVDACYLCLYRPADDTLFFVYNFDRGIYDEPLILSVKDGPTSHVVRHNAAFVLDEGNWKVHNANVDFGDSTRLSRSALHLPLRAADELLGVFSVQSYAPNAYGPATLGALQLWCDHAALHLHGRHRERAHQSERARQDAQLQSVEAHKIRLADHFVALLQPLTRQAQDLARQLANGGAPSHKQIKAEVDAICRNCYRLQTQASQLPLATHALTPPSEPILAEPNPLDVLSQSELEVLRLLATGASNPQIADAIGRTVDTAKKHCAGIYRKLGARNRTEAAQIYNRCAALTKNIRKGNANPT